VLRGSRRGSWVLIALVTVGLAACGSSDDSAATGSGSSGSESAESAAFLEKAYSGATGTPPTTPTTAKPGVNVWVVSCGEQVPSCSTPTAAAMEAAKLVGWKPTMCDGQLNPGGWGTCVRQAVSAKAQVILPVGIDCASIQAPFQEAKNAGVVVVGAGGADCDVTGGQPLWASERLQLPDVSIKEYWQLNGKLNADWIIGKTDGQAKVLLVNFTDPLWAPWITEGFKNELATCSGCTVVETLDLANNDFVNNTAAQKFSTALLQASTANAVFIPIGGWMTGGGLAQVVMSSGRAGQINVATGFGEAGNMELIRNNQGQNAVLGYATEWGAYGSIDTAIRVLNGEQPQVQGDGFQVVDAEHNLPPAGSDYTPSVDFKTAYKKLWGVG
jgi:ribose transport system substrate-binding protein